MEEVNDCVYFRKTESAFTREEDLKDYAYRKGCELKERILENIIILLFEGGIYGKKGRYYRSPQNDL